MAESAYTLQWAHLSTRIAPSHGESGPPMLHMMLSVHTSSQPKRHLDRFSRLCTYDCGVSLYSHVSIWTSFNTWFIGPTRVRNANDNLIVSAVFAGLTDWQSDRKTERPHY